MTEQAQVQFYDTMTSAKRGGGAYLRKNLLLSDDGGMYPSTDFVNKAFDSTPTNTISKGYFTINNFVFVEGTEGTAVYHNGTGSELDFVDYLLDSSDPIAVCETDDPDVVLVLLQNGKIYQITTSSVSTLIGQLTGTSVTGHMVYDGFYWFISFGTVLYRLDPDLTTITTVKSTTAESQSDIVNMQLFNDYIVFARELGTGIQFDFWSITDADIDLYQKRVIEKNCKHLGLGVLNGSLLFVKSIGNTSNRKESEGQVVVGKFDGEKFVTLNSIRAGNESVLISGTQQQAVGNGIMVIAIKENENDITDALFKNWILKIREAGEIEVIAEPGDITNGFSVETVGVEYSTVTLLMEMDDNTVEFYHTDDPGDAYAEYETFTTAQYITNFLNNTKNVHKLTSIGVAFEKAFEQTGATRGERLFIDYRTSERDDWTLLHEITTEKIKDYTADEYSVSLRQAEYDSDTTGQTIQSYVITKMPDGSELPRYNEIQFRFRSKKGFTVIQSWYNYEYIIRNTA